MIVINITKFRRKIHTVKVSAIKLIEIKEQESAKWTKKSIKLLLEHGKVNEQNIDKFALARWQQKTRKCQHNAQYITEYENRYEKNNMKQHKISIQYHNGGSGNQEIDS